MNLGRVQFEGFVTGTYIHEAMVHHVTSPCQSSQSAKEEMGNLQNEVCYIIEIIERDEIGVPKGVSPDACFWMLIQQTLRSLVSHL